MEGLAVNPVLEANYGIEPGFWSGQRVFVTGHTGFKGAWLTIWLRELGAIVAGYSLPAPTQPSLHEVIGHGHLAVDQVADIRDRGALHTALAAFTPTVVMHLAAQAVVRRSYDDPLDTFATNVIGTANVLEACRGITGLRAVLVCTSDKCYRNEERGAAFREDDPLGGHDPYSASKACAELVTTSYRQSFFSPRQGQPAAAAVGSARAGNVVGGGDWAADRLVPDAVRAFGAGRPLTIRNPQARRPWQFVLEPLSGYLALARALAERGSEFALPWNFGPLDDSVWSVEQIADRLRLAWGNGARVVADAIETAKHEAGVLRLDSSQAMTRLGWRPRMTVGDALDETARWYKAYLSGASAGDMAVLSREQIHAYTSIATAATR